ncbi:hypothetical protein GD1_183 [Paraglaciecola Antarctic GD virus 1]|nr:hypothetical protein GD1_183 [Paraglaciecola Antarctic GD virus 1]
MWNSIVDSLPKLDTLVRAYGEDSFEYQAQLVFNGDETIWLDVNENFSEVNTTVSHWQKMQTPFDHISVLPTIRVFNIYNGYEISLKWTEEFLEEFSASYHKAPFTDGQIMFIGSYYKVMKVIRNFDRNEVFIYRKHLVGYNPMDETNII